jgi:hypothetical protein
VGAKRRTRKDSDEYYVVTLFNEVLKEVGLWQHRFAWLRGSTGRPLKVDAYYPRHNLIVEYHEVQHTRPVPIMDKPRTASRIPRREQRAMYSKLRRNGAAENGIRFVEIHYHQLDAKPSGKLRRNREEDLGRVKAVLVAGRDSPETFRGSLSPLQRLLRGISLAYRPQPHRESGRGMKASEDYR